MMIYLQMIETPQDKSKFEAIYEKYRGLLYNIAIHKLCSTQDAEDAVHHAFVKIAENIKKLDSPCPKTKKFVVIVIENHIKNILIARSRHPVVSLEDWHWDDYAVETDGMDILSRCINDLPLKQRDILLLKYEHGYSLREIAEILDISLADVRKTEQRAKAKLEKLYCERGGII